MKRSAILLCVAAALSLGCIAAAHGLILGTADEVEFRETVLYGDLAAAEGLTLTARQSCDRRLYWESVLPAAAPGLARTECTVLSARKIVEAPRPTGMMVSFSLGEGNYDFGSGMEPGTLSATLRDTYWGDAFYDLLQPVVDRTEAGEVHTETLRVRDCLKYLPLTFHLELGDGSQVLLHGKPYFLRNDESGLGELLRGAFRVPVPENATLTVTVAKNARGMVTALNAELNRTGGIEACSALTEGKCWFALYSYGEEPLDFGELRDGYGLYCLPLVGQARWGSYGNIGTEVDADALHAALPFAEGETPVDLMEGGDGTLLVLLRTEAGLDLVVLDEETERLRERLTLFDGSETGEDDWVCVPLEGGRLYTLCPSRVRYYERGADGRYALLLDAPAGALNELDEWHRESALRAPLTSAWDGERLAVAIAGSSGYGSFGSDGEYRSPRGELLLCVFDGSGPRCCAALSSGPMRTVESDCTRQVVWGEGDVAPDENDVFLSFDSQWSAAETASRAGVSFDPVESAFAGRQSGGSGAGIIGGADGPTAIFVR